MEKQIEPRRFLTANAELHIGNQSENGLPQIGGYAARFLVWSQVIGWGFREMIEPQAFDNVMDLVGSGKMDVMARVQHEGGLALLGRTSNKTLTVWVDKQGLRYLVQPPDTQAGRDTVELVRRGDIAKSSFAFVVGKERSIPAIGTEPETRIIEDIAELIDVSPVDDPAYTQTSVEILRAFERARECPPVDWGKRVQRMNTHEAREDALRILR